MHFLVPTIERAGELFHVLLPEENKIWGASTHFFNSVGKDLEEYGVIEIAFKWQKAINSFEEFMAFLACRIISWILFPLSLYLV